MILAILIGPMTTKTTKTETKNQNPETGKGAFMNCPACSSTQISTDARQVNTCGACGAIFADNLYLGDSYAIVKPFMSERVDMDDAVYFDFTCLGSKGLTRRHGWFDPETGLILQVG